MEKLADLPARERWLRIEALHGDASSRRYSRLWRGDGSTVILARYPAGLGNTLARDPAVQRWLAQHQLRVPAIIDCDLAARWLLVEDFGAADAEQTLRDAQSDERPALFGRLLEPLLALSAVPVTSLPSWNEPLAYRRLRWELAGFELWFVRHLRGLAPSATVGRWLDHLAGQIDRHPRRICHRDYHLNNLFLLADGTTGMIDAQDLLAGPDTYDASSLLWERAGPELIGNEVRQGWLERWAEQTAVPSGWRQRCQQTRLQRGLKVLGTFARLHLEGRPGYHHWIAPLAHDLAGELCNLSAPGELLSLLSDPTPTTTPRA